MQRLMTVGAVCGALAVLGAAGCGDDDEDTGGDGGGQAATPAETAPAEAPAAETQASSGGEKITVTMKDFAFAPADVEAKVGDTIEWVNEDSAPHNAVAEGGDLKTETFEKGGSDTYSPTAAGTIEYICTVHPQMKGTITVTD